MKRILGQLAEQQARDYLESCGLIWECSNYLCPAGEIDLIMCDPGVCADQETIVFVEVRYRKAWDYGESVETVVWHKQHRIIKAAWHYLIENNAIDKINGRFDVIGLSPGEEICWIKNAFEVEY